MAPKAKAPAAKAEAKAKANPKKKEERKEEDPESKIPKVDQPDRAAFDEKVAAIGVEIEKLQKEQKGLSERINERSGGKDEFFQKKAELRAQLDECSKHMNALQARKDDINKMFGDKQAEGREMRQQVNKLKKSIGYTSESAIDERIASIEFKLWTDSHSLKEEKKYLAEIQELKRIKPKVSEVSKLETDLETRDSGLPMKEQLQGINAEMATWRDKKRGISEKLNELTEGRKSQLGDMPQLIEGRDAISKKIQEFIKDRNALRDEFRAKENEFRAYLAEVRKVRQEKFAKEREERYKEQDVRRREKEAEKLDEQPHLSEITLIEQTMLFCRTLQGIKGVEKQEVKKETVYDNPDDTVVLKKNEEEEFYFAPTKAGKKSKSKVKGKAEGGPAKPIKHNAETFQLFSKLKLDAPITTDDIPATLEKLEAQLEGYKEKVAKWEEKRELLKKKILEEGVLPEDEDKAEEKTEEKEADKEEES
eukprot:CAMPEP_0170621250 /NCGR_PEP_ID=MMETSP0224-20130122/28503_1 /TAXON_ID=285029 /ORGANISM="Togula jolla, Strain CCCM 725" /LENGTH=478 /DNA_ID=CAMNT_0010947501 /DNA_START=82 /DNA_END=1518 /DNA_ORIENTATION=-